MSACFLSNALKRAFLAFLVSNKVLFLAWQGAAKPLRGDDYVNVDDNPRNLQFDDLQFTIYTEK